ncbi:MAG: adenylyltransferase/cytidyltransferase family protein [Candidatus Hydrogenedentes bacterium]|nr:adenylyltransferase/cytidyltransferase family protein [Candidatus Hydrogenedentota bacterium]
MIPESAKTQSLESLIGLAGHWRRQGKSIVWTNGCFEILHSGHIEFLLKASRLGDVFIVGVNGDASVKTLKGENHPLTGLAERLWVLSAVQCVDYLTVFNEPNCANILRALKPDVYAKGLRHIHGGLNGEERQIIEENGGCVALIAGDPAKSTENIMRRIKSAGH